jgi:phosphoglycerate dehydrogenase-like enzyme
MKKHNELTIACDLFLDLKLYHLPDSFQKTFRENFPNIKLVEFNTPNAEVVELESIDIYWGNRITKKIIDKLPVLKWIHFGSVGVNAAMIKEVKDRNIIVSNSIGIVTNAVMSTGLAFLFSLGRGFHYSWNLQNKNQFNRESFDVFYEQVHDIIGQSVLIAGFGEIGEKLAKGCHDLGLKVKIVRLNKNKKPSWVTESYSLDELKTAVSEADYVINLLPLNNETRGVFSKDIFLKMKQTSFFINIGRGDSVIEDDLIYALKKNIIAGAGLDVFSSSSYVNPATPLNPDSPLLGLENVILTPHVAGLTNQYWDRECTLFMENLELFCDGGKIKNEVIIENV